MRTLIRRNPEMTYDAQMYARGMDALASRTHPNGIANTERQRAESRYTRDTENALKCESRQKRTARRMQKKAARQRTRERSAL